MNYSRLLILVITVFVLMQLNPAFAETKSGPRIPTKYFVTTGSGQSDDGIPPDPYETFSYDLALKEAGIENFNVMYYTSVLPKESFEVSIDDVKDKFHHGAVLECIMAKAGSIQGDTVATGVGRIWAKDKDGNVIGGFAAEYERIYKITKVSKEQAEADAIKQLSKSLKHELTIRNLEQHGEMKFNVNSLYISKKYGISLSAIGFLNFIYPDPVK